MKRLSKKLIIVAGLLLLCSSLHAQIRNYVGVVREQYFESHVKFMEDYRDNLKDNGLVTYSKNVDSYLKGSFGSGFVYVDLDGTNYIITNRHVVSQAEKASIEFEDSETGAVTKYENLTVLITDDDIDIAILKFADGKNPFKKGLTISSAKINDGDDVLTAGFPGLAGDPVWQLGKGSVTNARARIKELLDPSISTVIQHSAQVHGGNSGGPLLIASSKGTAGYEVVGINTWKSADRDSTNFSIPAKLALQLIEKSKKVVDSEVVKNQRLAKLKEILVSEESDYLDIVKFISYEYATNAGPAFFKEIIGRGSTAVRSTIINEFAYNPAEGLRYSAAYKFFKDYSKENATDENLSKIVWVKEHGLYRVSMPITKEVKKDIQKSKTSNVKGTVPSVVFNGFTNEAFMLINVGANYPILTDAPTKQFNAIANFNVFPGLWGMGICYENKNLLDKNYNLVGGQFFLVLPINFELFTVKPYVDGGFQGSIGKDMVLGGFAEAGCELLFDFGLNTIRPGIDVSYRFCGYNLEELNTEVSSCDLSVRFVLGFSFY